MNRTVLVLGGYGGAGRRITELLARESGVRVVVGGRQLGPAQGWAAELNRELRSERVTAVLAEASNPSLLRKALADVDLVVVASSTAAHVATVAQAAIEAEVDYLDIQYSTSKLRVLDSMRAEIERRGRCFITDGGFHPGLPAVLIRFAAGFLDRLQRANVAAVARIDWRNRTVAASTSTEFAEELRHYEPTVLKRGTWARSRWWERKRFAFGKPFGTLSTVPMQLGEMRNLPHQFPMLVDAGFYVAGLNWFVDYLAMPFGMLAQRLAGDRATPAVGKLIGWGLRTFTVPPYGTVAVVEASGWKKGRLVAVRGRIAHEDGYELTAITVVGCLLQYLDGSARRPGLWHQAHLVDPRRLVTDLERLGATVEYDLEVET
jgi:saccharopine dehydrogenase (NAD+, L-lysine-forming)